MYKTNPWVIISVILLTTIIVGGGVYFGTKQQTQLAIPGENDIQEIEDNAKDLDKDQETEPKASTPTPNGEGQSEAAAIYGIAEAMAEEHDKEVADVNITITDLSKGYAFGGVIFAPGGVGNGGIFYAMVVDGAWTIVHDGQDAPTCTHLTDLGFPGNVGMDSCY